MKKLMILILLIVFLTVLLSAELIDVYKKGTIKLIPDLEFGKDSDWGKLFSDFLKVSGNGKPIGLLKNIAVAEDGSIFLSNYSQYNIYKFDKDGNFIRKFGKKGNKPGEFLWRPGSISILDNKYLAVTIYHGKIHLFDLDGNFIKRMEIDYPVLDCVALKDRKIAIAGSVPYKGMRSKELIAIKDIDSEKENILTYFMADYFKNVFPFNIQSEDGDIKFYSTLAFSQVYKFTRHSLDGNLIVGYSDKKDILVYSPDGRELDKFTLDIEPLKISEKIKQEYRESSRKSLEQSKGWLKKMSESQQKEDLSEKIIKELSERPINFPEFMPYYYNLLVDSDNNTLVFLYTEENDILKFQVYSQEGEYICESTIDPGEYKIKFYRNHIPLVFFKGNIFALVTEKDNLSTPLRLIKVNLN